MECYKYLLNQFVEAINSWNVDKIRAVSVMVYSNECYVYRGVKNYFEVSIGYIPCFGDSDVLDTDALIDREDVKVVVDYYKKDDVGAALVWDWLHSIKVENIGFEDESQLFDDDLNYIGKGPNGYYELLMLVSDVMREIQSKGIISQRFGKTPVIVHELDTAWYIEGATRNANPNGEADEFLDYLTKFFQYCREL